VELRCTYDPASRGGNSPDGRKVKATIHWVAADKAVDIEARLYDRLFTCADLAKVEEGKDYKAYLNPQSLVTLTDAKAEPSLTAAKSGEMFQFERLGYFCVDRDSTFKKKIFNRTVTLKDEWARIEKRIVAVKK
jgi:glutaminyl-tRNA synthetase